MRGSMWTAIHVVLSTPVAFVVNIVVARVLGVADYGRLGLLTLTIVLATTAASMGVGPALVQFGSKAFSAGRQEELVSLIKGSQGYAIFVAAPVVAVAAIVLVPVSPRLLAVAVIFGVLVPAWLQAAPTVLALMQRTDLLAQLAIASNLVVQATVVTAVLLVGSAEMVWSARLIAVGSLMLLPLLAIPRVLRSAVLRPAAPWRLPRAFWVFAIPTGLATLLNTLVTDRVQIFFLQWWSDPQAVGLFALAFGLATNLLSPAQSMVGPLLPAFATLVEAGSVRARSGLLRALRVSGVITGAVVSLGAPFLAALVPAFYGDAFAASANYLVVIVAAAATATATAPAFASLMARLGGGTYLRVNAASMIALLGVGLGTVPFLGAWGAVASCVVGTVVRAMSIVALEMRYYEVPAIGAIRPILPAVLSAAAVLVAWFVLRPLLGGMTALVAPGSVSALLYLGLLRLTRSGLREHDVEGLVRHLPPALRGLAPIALRPLRSA